MFFNVLGFLFKLAIKLFLAVLAIPFILLIALFGFFAFIIDLFASIKDAEFLSDEETKKRSIDRSNKRQHDVLDKIFEFFKTIFFW